MAYKALDLKKNYIKKMVNEYDKRRRFIIKRLNELKLMTKMPEGAFYAFANISNYRNNSLNFTKELIKKARVAVIPGTEFGKFGENYIRLSYAASLENIEKAMNRIEKVL